MLTLSVPTLYGPSMDANTLKLESQQFQLIGLVSFEIQYGGVQPKK